MQNDMRAFTWEEGPSGVVCMFVYLLMIVPLFFLMDLILVLIHLLITCYRFGGTGLHLELGGSVVLVDNIVNVVVVEVGDLGLGLGVDTDALGRHALDIDRLGGSDQPHRLRDRGHTDCSRLFRNKLYHRDEPVKDPLSITISLGAGLNNLQVCRLEDTDTLKPNLSQGLLGLTLGLHIEEVRIGIGAAGGAIQKVNLGQSSNGILGGLLVDLTSRIEDVLLINLLEGFSRSGGSAGGAQGAKDNLGQVRAFVGEGGGNVFKVNGLLVKAGEVGESGVVVGGDGAAAEGEDSREGV